MRSKDDESLLVNRRSGETTSLDEQPTKRQKAGAKAAAAKRDAVHTTSSSLKQYLTNRWTEVADDGGACAVVCERHMAECPYQDGTLEMYLAGVYLGRLERVPVIATVKCEGSVLSLLDYIGGKLRHMANSRAVPFEVVASVGREFPVPVLRLDSVIEWLKQTDRESYEALARGGMVQPLDLFKGRLLDARKVDGYFTVIASLDVGGAFGTLEQRTARRIFQSLYQSGISVLGVYEDNEGLELCNKHGIFGEIPVFSLGRF